MAHREKKRLADKHPLGTSVSETLRQAVLAKSEKQSITCAAAHAIARDLTISPAEVGQALDILECRLTKCQLGLFGRPSNNQNLKQIHQVPAELEQAITTTLQNGRLPCHTAWQLAATHHVSRLEFGAVCDCLKIKITPCQLGAF